MGTAVGQGFRKKYLSHTRVEGGGISNKATLPATCKWNKPKIKFSYMYISCLSLHSLHKELTDDWTVHFVAS